MFVEMPRIPIGQIYFDMPRYIQRRRRSRRFGPASQTGLAFCVSSCIVNESVRCVAGDCCARPQDHGNTHRNFFFLINLYYLTTVADFFSLCLPLSRSYRHLPVCIDLLSSSWSFYHENFICYVFGLMYRTNLRSRNWPLTLIPIMALIIAV